MRRLPHTFKLDIRLQYRNGFYAAAIFVSIVFVAVILWLDSDLVVKWMPIILFGNVQFSTFYFMAAMVLMEKEEGTVYAQGVSPMSANEYLASKALSLSTLITMECMVLVIASGVQLNTGFVISVILTVFVVAYLYCLIGFLCVYRYPNINRFLLPSMIMTFIAGLPFFGYLEVWPSVLFYLHPLTAPLYAIGETFNDGFSYVPWNEPFVLAAVIVATLIVLQWLAARAYRSWLVRI